MTIKVPMVLAVGKPNFARHYRRALAGMALTFGRTPRGTRSIPAIDQRVRGEWIVPVTAGVSPLTILYLHGGGYVAGSPAQYRALTGALALACGARVFALDYRLAPEHPHPAALEDALLCYQWLLEQGVLPAQIVVGGDSAGGGLTLSLLLAARDRGLPLPAGGILLSPWVDLTGTAGSIESNEPTDDVIVSDETHALAHMYAGELALDDPRVSGLFADLSGLPPLLIQASTIEMLRDDAVRLEQKARAAGVDAHLRLWNGVTHVWQLFTNLPESREAFADIAAFIDRFVPHRKEDLVCPV